ncbi:MAG TPA: hypothetical protein PKC67_07040 [Kiritimatiellia bacterium]|nr:hypothetical protein [Kiritimatiellia bacterium]HMP34093.1 hypothetical protein [Kiritimatiellia bacterium]
MFRYALLLVVFSGQSAVSQEVISAGGKAEPWSMPQALLMDAATGSTLVAEAALIVSESVDMKASAGGQAMERGSLVQPEKTIVYDDGTIIKEILPGGYRKIATGLLRPDAEGKLVPSSLTPMLKSSGGLAFPDAPLRVDIAASANRQTVVETRRHDQAISARSAVAAIAYYDAQRPSRLILANVVDAKVEAHATGAVFYDAFDHVDADILYTIHPWGLEQDVVIYGGLPTPEAVGLQPETTFLCVLTELLDVGNNPQLVQRKGEKEPDDAGMAPLHVYKMVNDEPVRIHDFQSGVAYEHQTALSVGGLAKSSEPVTVRHRIFQAQGRWFLSEEVAVSDIQQHTPDIFKPEASMKTVESLPATRPESIADTDAEWMRAQEPLLAYQPRQREAFVIDYLDYSGTTSNNIVFATGETYFIPSDLVINGASLTIMPGAIVKFATNATIKLINGATIINKSHLLDPAIFTSAHDSQFGEAIPGYTNPPANHLYASAFELENWNAVTIEGIRIRYASTGIKAETSGHTIRHSLIEKGWQGIDIHSASTGGAVTVRNVLFSHLNRGLTAGSQNSNVTVYLYNSTMHAVSEYGVATNTKVNQFSIQCSLFASVTNELSKGSPVSGMGGSSNFVYNSPTQGLGSVTVLTNNPFQAGTYGSNYLGHSSALINGGYISSDYWLLYHFTTATNHAKESNTVVDVGFHYPSPADTDGDGLYDFVEDASGNGTYTSNSVDVADLNAYDTDGDGLNDYDEYMVHGTNPKSYDTDGDGFDDAHELSVGSDPLSATSYPVRISGPITYSGGQTGSLHIAIRSFEPVPYPTAFYMPFTTNEGSMVHDRSGRGNTGTVQGATWSSAGIKGGAYSFDGDDRILVGDLAVVEGQTNVTFGAWIKRTGGSSLNGIMGKTVAENESMYLLLNSGGAGGVAYVVPQSKSLESYAEKSPIVTNHHWMHLAGVYSGTNMRLYANGQCVATGATHALEAVRSNTVTAAIGDVASNRGWYFTGLIDEVTIYQHALSDALVKAMAQDAQAGLVNRQAASNGIPASYSTPEVPSGSNYWVVAWIDTNGNGDREYWEPYGAYTSNPVLANGPVSGAAITVLDPDADGDGAADWREVLLGTDPFNKDSYPTTIAGTVIYTGGQTGPVRVVATGTNYVPFTAVIAAPGAYTISNVPNQRTYTVSAFRDSNTNGVMEYAEAQGTYSNNPITLLTATTNISITLTEADTDGDGMPDWWEIFYGLNPTSGVHASQVAWWRFEEVSGLTASNVLNASHHGSMTNMSVTNRVGGKLGQGMWFDGVDDRIEIPASLSAAITNRITVDAWVKAETLDEASLYRGILSEKYVGDQNVQFAVHLYGSNHNVRAGFFNGGWRLATDTNSFTTSAWRRVSATFNGTNIVIYTDGFQVATGTAIYNLPIGTNGWRIGQRHDGGGPSDMWHGLIDEVRVYSSALSSNQVATLYDAFGDLDNDGIINQDEYIYRTNPNSSDTDGDGLSDQEEVFTHGTNPASTDTDGDGLSDFAELNDYLTDPKAWDSDGDGIDDGEEIENGTNPLDVLASTGLNRNWMFFNNPDYALPSWELIPGMWQRFHVADYATGTNTLFVILPKKLGLNPAGTNEVEVRLFWAHPPPSTNVTEQWLNAHYYTSTVVSSSRPFHGLPTMNQVTVDVYRLRYAQPPFTNNVDIWYAPLIKSYTNTIETDYVYLASKLTDGDLPVNGYNSNNWLVYPQYYAKAYFGRDHHFWHAPTRLKNGGFEAGAFFWVLQSTNAVVSTNEAFSGGQSLFIKGSDEHVAYQNIAVHAGEELIVSGRVKLPSMVSSAPAARRLVLKADYYDSDGIAISSLKSVWDSSVSTTNQWEFLAITSLVPRRAKSMNVSIRTVSAGPWTNELDGAFIDDIQVQISPDSDSDGIPDWWENDNNLNPWDPTDAIFASNNNGVLNVDKYRLSLDSSTEDTDGDGIPDWWELENGMNPQDPSDANMDYDHDGLSNYEEFYTKTSIWNADTDGDGLEDGIEVFDFGSNPLSNDFGGFELVQQINGASISGMLGDWRTNASFIYAAGHRGYVEYTINIATANLYRVSIKGNDFSPDETTKHFDLDLSINNIPVSRQTLYAFDNAEGSVSFYTPWLSPGLHTLRIFCDNISYEKQFQCRSVEVHRVTGPDSNANGVLDWAESKMSRSSYVYSGQQESSISPACLEGSDEYVGMSSSSHGSILRGPGHQWYVNVPLNATAAVNHVTTFQAGGRVVTNAITWKPLNVFENKNVYIRKNDSLMISAHPAGATNGVTVISLAGSVAYTASAPAKVVHTFGSTGRFAISGAYKPESGQQISQIMFVHVVDAVAPDYTAVWVGTPRIWSWPNLSSNVVVDFGNDMVLAELGDATNGARDFICMLNEPTDHYIALRAGENGTVITNYPLRGFRFGMEAETYLNHIATCRTGDRLSETMAICYPTLSGLEIKGSIIVGGSLFEDGSISRTWSSSDFDSLGQLPIRFIQSAYSLTAPCNTIFIYQGTNFIGQHIMLE